jgi:hypothetical protein
MNLGKSFLYYFYYLRERSTVYQEWKWSSWALDPQDGHEVPRSLISCGHKKELHSSVESLGRYIKKELTCGPMNRFHRHQENAFNWDRDTNRPSLSLWSVIGG